MEKRVAKISNCCASWRRLWSCTLGSRWCLSWARRWRPLALSATWRTRAFRLSFEMARFGSLQHLLHSSSESIGLHSVQKRYFLYGRGLLTCSASMYCELSVRVIWARSTCSLRAWTRCSTRRSCRVRAARGAMRASRWPTARRRVGAARRLCGSTCARSRLRRSRRTVLPPLPIARGACTPAPCSSSGPHVNASDEDRAIAAMWALRPFLHFYSLTPVWHLWSFRDFAVHLLIKPKTHCGLLLL